MFRILAAATLLAAPALPALAQAIDQAPVEASGATAGRSPHRVYRPIAKPDGCGRPAMHPIPAGKGHVFGSWVHAGAPCEPAHVATADGTAPTRRE